MSKFLLKIFLVSSIGVVTVYNVYKSQQITKLSDLALANILALANGESSEDFTNKTGCIAVWENYTCRGKDGLLYSYAVRK